MRRLALSETDNPAWKCDAGTPGTIIQIIPYIGGILFLRYLGHQGTYRLIELIAMLSLFCPPCTPWAIGSIVLTRKAQGDRAQASTQHV